MKHSILYPALAAAFLCVLLAPEAPAQTRTVRRVSALDLVTNDVPKSVFVIPTPESQSRDPFFPDSMRLKPGSSEPVAPRPSIRLLYNGLSGTADKPLAIINGRTLAQGEEAEIRSGGARVTIRCISIQGETVVVEVNGRTVTLRLGEKN